METTAGPVYGKRLSAVDYQIRLNDVTKIVINDDKVVACTLHFRKFHSAASSFIAKSLSSARGISAPSTLRKHMLYCNQGETYE